MEIEFKQEIREATVEQYISELSLIALEQPKLLSEIGMKVALGVASPNLTAAWMQWRQSLDPVQVHCKRRLDLKGSSNRNFPLCKS